TPRNIGDLGVSVYYDALTYRVYVMAILRDLIVGRKLFDLRVDEYGLFRMEAAQLAQAQPQPQHQDQDQPQLPPRPFEGASGQGERFAASPDPQPIERAPYYPPTEKPVKPFEPQRAEESVVPEALGSIASSANIGPGAAARAKARLIGAAGAAKPKPKKASKVLPGLARVEALETVQAPAEAPESLAAASEPVKGQNYPAPSLASSEAFERPLPANLEADAESALPGQALAAGQAARGAASGESPADKAAESGQGASNPSEGLGLDLARAAASSELESSGPEIFFIEESIIPETIWLDYDQDDKRAEAIISSLSQSSKGRDFDAVSSSAETRAKAVEGIIEAMDKAARECQIASKDPATRELVKELIQDMGEASKITSGSDLENGALIAPALSQFPKPSSGRNRESGALIDPALREALRQELGSSAEADFSPREGLEPSDNPAASLSLEASLTSAEPISVPAGRPQADPALADQDGYLLGAKDGDSLGKALAAEDQATEQQALESKIAAPGLLPQDEPLAAALAQEQEEPEEADEDDFEALEAAAQVESSAEEDDSEEDESAELEAEGQDENLAEDDDYEEDDSEVDESEALEAEGQDESSAEVADSEEDDAEELEAGSQDLAEDGEILEPLEATPESDLIERAPESEAAHGGLAQEDEEDQQAPIAKEAGEMISEDPSMDEEEGISVLPDDDDIFEAVSPAAEEEEDDSAVASLRGEDEAPIIEREAEDQTEPISLADFGEIIEPVYLDQAYTEDDDEIIEPVFSDSQGRAIGPSESSLESDCRGPAVAPGAGAGPLMSSEGDLTEVSRALEAGQEADLEDDDLPDDLVDGQAAQADLNLESDEPDEPLDLLELADEGDSESLNEGFLEGGESRAEARDLEMESLEDESDYEEEPAEDELDDQDIDFLPVEFKVATLEQRLALKLKERSSGLATFQVDLFKNAPERKLNGL
ncbi:MAG: hypothetical protein LBE49_01330, partial [Deltaproteobacteria bacterium]|nr:hypothetical protein [Deltaproteobacteria bacterium]